MIIMNIQAMMKQAQKMQQELLKNKKEIEEKVFLGEHGEIRVKVNGKREVKSVEINSTFELIPENREVLEDMILLAVNDALMKIDKEFKIKLGNLDPSISDFM